MPGFDYFWTVAFAELLVFTPRPSPARRRAGSLGSVLRDRRAPLRLYVAQAIVMAIYAAIAKIAYKYLNYATGTVLRSTKLVFVMAISVVWLGRSYAPVEYAAAVAMIVAVACFGLGEESAGTGHDENHAMGYVLSLAGLALAALQTNMAEQRHARPRRLHVGEHALRQRHRARRCRRRRRVRRRRRSGDVLTRNAARDGPARRALRDLLLRRALTFTELTRHSGATPATTVATARERAHRARVVPVVSGRQADERVVYDRRRRVLGAIALELKGRMARAEIRKKEAAGSQ